MPRHPLKRDGWHGPQLKRRREKCKVTQERFAAQINVTTRTISKHEHRSSRGPVRVIREKWRRALKSLEDTIDE